MIDGSEKRNRQLAFELQNLHVCEKRSKLALTDACNVFVEKRCWHCDKKKKKKKLQLNLSTKATLGTEESGRCREVLNKKSMYGFLCPRDKINEWPFREVVGLDCIYSSFH